MKRKILFICKVVKWFDKINGNTYHSVRVTRCKDNKTIASPFTYGYGEAYRNTALLEMLKSGWLPKKYPEAHWVYLYERENNYPIYWNVIAGAKRDCIANGVL